MKKGEVPGVDFSSGEWYSVLKSVKRFHTLKRSAMALEVMSSNSSNERNWAMKIKQLFVGVAMVGLIGMVPSLSRAEVSSAVIGMQEIEITTTWTLLGVSFFDMKDTSVETISVHDFISGDFNDGDQIQVQSDGGYRTAVWSEENGFWSIPGFRGAPSANKSLLSISKGDGVWLKKVNASSDNPQKVSLFGRVILTPYVEVDFSKSYKLVSLPIFEEIPLDSAKISWSGLVNKDQVQVPIIGGGFRAAVWNEAKGFWSIPGFRGAPTENVSSLTLSPGCSFWLISSSSNASFVFDGSK